ncbi:MAG: NARF domain-containing protein [Bacteroidota bacterium]
MKSSYFWIMLLIFYANLGSTQDSSMIGSNAQQPIPVQVEKAQEVEAELLDYLQIGNLIFGGLVGGLMAFLIQKVVIQGKINNDIEAHSLAIEKNFAEEKKKLDEQFKSSINLRKEKIEGWIQDHDWEKDLIDHCVILLVGQKDHRNVRKLLTQMGFRDKNIIDEKEATQGKAYEILFINNEDAHIRVDATLLKWVEEMPSKTLAFYYDKTRSKHYPTNDLSPALQNKLNFVNAPAQIFGNLMNTIKYRDRLVKNGVI